MGGWTTCRARTQWEAYVQGTMRRQHLEGRGFTGEAASCTASNAMPVTGSCPLRPQGRGGQRWHRASFPGKAEPRRLLPQLISAPRGLPALY